MKLKRLVAQLVLVLCGVGWVALWIGVCRTQHNWDFLGIAAVPWIFLIVAWAWMTLVD